MKKIKSILAFALALGMCTSMAACGSNSNDESSKTETSSATTEATTEESTEDTSEGSAETTTTIAAESADNNDADNASESSAQTDVDSFFASLNGKTLDDAKAYIESAFQVGECEESINAYTTRDADGNSDGHATVWLYLAVKAFKRSPSD